MVHMSMSVDVRHHRSPTAGVTSVSTPAGEADDDVPPFSRAADDSPCYRGVTQLIFTSFQLNAISLL
jgi:hypothetical protein